MLQTREDSLTWKIARRIIRATETYTKSFRTKRLIVFLTPGHDFRSGGILSIGSLYRESKNLKSLHNSTVALCAVPGDPFLLRYTWFENRNYILDLDSLLRLCGHLEYLQLHIPEYTINQVLTWLERSASMLQKIEELRFNVLLQNIELIEGQNVEALKSFGKVTCTTAHEAYCTPSTRQALGIGVHRLGCYHGPELFSPTGYRDKEPLLLVSDDRHPLKEQVLRAISRGAPELRIQVIQDLSYEEYKDLIRRAKWLITFGEGLDSYFTEFAYSGGVPFAVFNERFFTPAFADLETVYDSWDTLLQRIVTDLHRLDEPTGYSLCSRQAYDLLSALSGVERFRENLKLFYRGEYTYP